MAHYPSISLHCAVCQKAYMVEPYRVGKSKYCSYSCYAHAFKNNMGALFWEKVDKRGPNECWLWMAGRDKDGYGRVIQQKKKVRAHRYSYQASYQDLTDTDLVLHLCDTPPCCNPAHLVKGTVSDNAKDSAKKGRNWHQQHPGANSPHAKLTQEQAEQIRTLKGKRAYRQLALQYGISIATISAIQTGKRYIPK